MKRKICALLSTILITTTLGCASMQSSTQSSTDPLASKAGMAIETLTWIKGVTDMTFQAGCATDLINASVCETYQVSAKAAECALGLSRNALANYRQTGTAINSDLLTHAIGDLLPVILEFDSIYKTPVLKGGENG